MNKLILLITVISSTAFASNAHGFFSDLFGDSGPKVPFLPNIHRNEPISHLRKDIWQDRTYLRERVDGSSDFNLFTTNEYSSKEEEMKSLIASYKEYFEKHKIDVEIEDKDLSQELILQVESFATYIEDILINKRLKDPLLELTYLRSTRNLYGGLVLNHKFIIKKGLSHKIKFSTENDVPTVTIYYKKFIDRHFLSSAAKASIPAAQSRKLPQDKNWGNARVREFVRYVFARENGIHAKLVTELGYPVGEKDFERNYNFVTYIQKEKKFNSPTRIDRAITDKYFKRVCQNMGVVYTPADLFLLFPQSDISKVSYNGNIRYLERNSRSLYRPEQLSWHLKREYSDVAEADCSEEEIEQYSIDGSKIDSLTGVSVEFLNYLLQSSMAYRFSNLGISTVEIKPVVKVSGDRVAYSDAKAMIEEIQCPPAMLCYRSGWVTSSGALSRESKSKVEVLRETYPNSKLSDAELLKTHRE